MISAGELWAYLGGLVVLLGGGLAWILTHLGQVQTIVAFLFRLFSWASRNIRLKAVSTQIQSRINVSADAIDSEVQGVMPYPMQIKWITKGEEQAHLKDGQVVVRVRNEFNDSRNIVSATMLYLKEGFLRKSRPYLDVNLLQALDLTVAWKILAADIDSDLSNYFLNHVFNPAVNQEPLMQEDCDKMNDLDEQGIMTRIFVREMRGIGTKIAAFGEKPTSDVRAETRNFADFLHTIVSSKKGATYPLNFVAQSIRAGVLPVARMETFARSGLRVHKSWFRKKTSMGVETVYVLARDRNIRLAEPGSSGS